MTSARRNLAIILVFLALIVAALLVIVPGSPISEPTRLGLDLKGGVELVYEGRPTPKQPEVTPQSIDDALETIRKRTDALGVSEPEIQRAGANQISIGLPAVKNADRAEQQVGTTAQLQFYDWAASDQSGGNVFGDPKRGGGVGGSAAPFTGLFPAAEFAAKQKPRTEKEDIPPGGASGEIEQRFKNNQAAIQRYYDRQNDSTGDKFYLFGPGEGPKRPVIQPGQVRAGQGDVAATQNQAGDFYGSCKEIFDDYQDR